MTVQTSSIVFMIVSVSVSILLPIGLFIFFRRKYNAKIIPLCVGVAAFIVFAQILEQFVHLIVLHPDVNGNIALKSQPFLYMLYGCMMAGIFEETARFISFNILKKKYHGIQTALSYGVGHGGIEAVLIGGASMISNIALSFMINSGSIGTITSTLSGSSLSQMNTVIASLVSTEPYMFAVAGIERIFALAIQISLSIIVFYSVYKNIRWLYPVAISLHAIIDIPAALSQTGVITNVFVIEGIVMVLAVATCIIGVLVHRKLKETVF